MMKINEEAIKRTFRKSSVAFFTVVIKVTKEFDPATNSVNTITQSKKVRGHHSILALDNDPTQIFSRFVFLKDDAPGEIDHIIYEKEKYKIHSSNKFSVFYSLTTTKETASA